MPPTRRRLSDLYVLGTDLAIGDDNEVDTEPVRVWVQKLNPLEQQTAVRRAGAERAKQLAFVTNDTSDEYQAALGDVIEFSDHDTLIDIAIRTDVLAANMKAEAETSGDERWSKDDYLTGLVTIWQEELSDRWIENPEDPEACRVKKELEDFDKIVEDATEAARIQLRKDYALTPIEDLRKLAVEALLEQRATQAFIGEFEVQQILFSIRFPEDHGVYYFQERLEVLGLDARVRSRLVEAYNLLSVDSQEGKDSAGNRASSTSSEQSTKEETPAASGLAVVTP